MITRHAIPPLMFSVHGIAESAARFVIETGLEIQNFSVLGPKSDPPLYSTRRRGTMYIILAHNS